MTLSDDQLQRYARHIVLRDVGGRGQAALLAARVLVVGAGGLGSACLHYLAAAGVGTIGIVDDDVVELSNLQRQVLHGTPDIGVCKTESAARALARLNPDVTVHQHTVRLSTENARELIAGYDIVADGSDSFATRHAVGDACLALGKPLVSAAIGSFEGQVATFRGHLANEPCYRCYVPESPAQAPGTCADEGVIGALAGIIGSLQALEVVREIVGFGTGLAGRLMIVDALDMRCRTLALAKDPQCPACRP